jgi:hypothetical protein
MPKQSLIGKAMEETLENEDSLGFKIFFFVTLGLAPLCFIGGWVEFGLVVGLLIAAVTSAAAFIAGCVINALIEVYWQVRLDWQARRRKSS